MRFSSEQADAGGITALVSRLADGMGKLVAQHLALAKLELVEDAKAVGSDIGKLLVFAPFLLVGYTLLCIAAALALSALVPTSVGFLIVALANLVGGAVGALVTLGRLKSRRMMDGSIEEISRSANVLSAQPLPNGTEGHRGQ